MTLILVYLILCCWYKFSKIKKNSNLVLRNNGEILVTGLFLLSFFVMFVIGLRVLNIFRENSVFDLKIINLNSSILILILYFILLWSLRKLMLYLFKINWFKFNYVFFSQNNFSFAKKYNYIYYNYIYGPACVSFKYLKYLNYVFIMGLYSCLIYDILINNLILNYTLWYLKYYSLFRLIYISYSFLANKQNVLLDFYTYNMLYPGDTTTSIFFNFKDPEHIFLMEESKKYVSGVILEKTFFEQKYYGDTKKMAFFKKIQL